MFKFRSVFGVKSSVVNNNATGLAKWTLTGVASLQFRGRVVSANERTTDSIWGRDCDTEGKNQAVPRKCQGIRHTH